MSHDPATAPVTELPAARPADRPYHPHDKLRVRANLGRDDV